MASIETFPITKVDEYANNFFLRIRLPGTEYPVEIRKIKPRWYHFGWRQSFTVGQHLVCRVRREELGIIKEVVPMANAATV